MAPGCPRPRQPRCPTKLRPRHLLAASAFRGSAGGATRPRAWSCCVATPSWNVDVSDPPRCGGEGTPPGSGVGEQRCLHSPSLGRQRSRSSLRSLRGGRRNPPCFLHPETRGMETSGSLTWSSACRLERRPPGGGGKRSEALSAAAVGAAAAAARQRNSRSVRGQCQGPDRPSGCGGQRPDKGHCSANSEFAHKCQCRCLFLEASTPSLGRD